jgi:hypothetical protein
MLGASIISGFGEFAADRGPAAVGGAARADSWFTRGRLTSLFLLNLFLIDPYLGFRVVKTFLKRCFPWDTLDLGLCDFPWDTATGFVTSLGIP